MKIKICFSICFMMLIWGCIKTGESSIDVYSPGIQTSDESTEVETETPSEGDSLEESMSSEAEASSDSQTEGTSSEMSSETVEQSSSDEAVAVTYTGCQLDVGICLQFTSVITACTEGTEVVACDLSGIEATCPINDESVMYIYTDAATGTECP